MGIMELNGEQNRRGEMDGKNEVNPGWLLAKNCSQFETELVRYFFNPFTQSKA